VLLEARGLGKDYGEVCAVAGVDFEIDEGEIVGLLGPNGAGKTTTISMIAGVLEPSRGTAIVAGHDIRREPFAARRMLGLVPQELALYQELSARQNLEFFASLYGLSGRERREAVAWALDIAGLGSRAEQRVSTFSGGMKRRLNLVAGLVHRPRLLILDEPTVGVDPQSRNFLFEVIVELARDGMAVLYTSHYMEEVELLCRRVAIIDGGELVALDTVPRLLAEHGTATAIVDYRGDIDSVRALLADREGVSIEESRVTLPAPSSIGALLVELEAAGLEIVRATAVERNLSTVFLNLTGHSLRDDE